MRFLFVDRIIQSSPGEFIKGVKHITQDDSCLTLDEQGRPCFIPAMIGETLGQLAAWNVMAQNQFSLRPVAGVVASARMGRPVYVGETLLLESFIDAVDEQAVQYHSEARVGTESVFSIEGALGPLLPMADFISADVVQAQYREIYRPGDWELITSTLAHVAYQEPENSVNLCQSMSFDRIIDLQAGEWISAEKKISRAAPYFPDHFPHKPVVPMTALLQCIQELTKIFLDKSSFASQYQLRELRRIKMNEFVQPGDVIHCVIRVKQQTADELVLSCRNEVAGKRVCVVELVLNAKGMQNE